MKKLFSYMMVCGAMMTAILGFTSCEDDLDVQQAYPFTVETMPVPKRLAFLGYSLHNPLLSARWRGYIENG